MSTLAVNTITNAAGGNTAQINGMTPTADSLQGFRNRIINGNMVIDQRNAGASVTPGSGDSKYPVDRFLCYASQNTKYTAQRNAGSVALPVGFSNYLGITSSSAYSVGSGDLFFLQQTIEGFNTSDFGFGTANASTITMSFWVRSSLTGTFGGVVQNSAQNRNYPFTFTISVANTWEQKSVTIVGDTTGTWVGATNGIGLRLLFALGTGSTYLGTAGAWTSSEVYGATGQTNLVATNGATFYITGVQLETGSVATPFERRPYGTELALCQRYYQKISLTANPQTWGNGYWNTTTQVLLWVPFITTMRAAPSALETDGVPNNYSVRYAGGRDSLSAGPTFQAATNFGIYVAGTASGTRTAGHGSVGQVEASTFLAWSAEL